MDHPCYRCAKCVTNRLYDPDLCKVCTTWLKNINENSASAGKSSDLWIKWNRSLVSIWKHNKVVQYNKPDIDMIVWADGEKFTLWEPFLPAPKIRLRNSSLVTLFLLTAGQGVTEQVTPVLTTPAPHTESCALLPLEAARDPSIGSDWSGFPEDLEEPFPDLFSELDMAPPVSALNPSQKRGHSPKPSRRLETVAADDPVSPAAGAQPGFSADQLAAIKALIQSCLVPPALSHLSPSSTSAISLPAPLPPTMTVPEIPRAGPSWALDPMTTDSDHGPSGVQTFPTFEPQPGPSWASDPPLLEHPEELGRIV